VVSKQTVPAGISSSSVKFIPDDWSAQWFRKFITNYLQNADTRNAIGGPGITITGGITTPATVSASTIVGEPQSVYGNPGSTTAPNTSIEATANGQVLQLAGGALVFATLPFANGGGLTNTFTVSNLTPYSILQANADGNAAAFSSIEYPTAVSPGDILIGTAANAIGSLTIGTTGQFLGISAGAPEWMSVSLPQQSAGWGAPTGAVVQNNFSGTAATLAQTSAAVAELIANLISAGVLGT
jgi:hypothetical protein